LAGQARKLSQLMPLLAANRLKLKLIGFDWYTWVSDDDPNGALWNYSGLETFASNSFSAKPSLAAFKRGALALEGCRSKGRVATSCLH
jgi:hypothetical protein